MNDPGSWGGGLGPQGASEWHTAFVSAWIHLFCINLFHLGKVSSGFWSVSVLKEICKKKISRINYSLHFRGWFWGHKWYSSFFSFTIHSRFPLPSTSAGLDGLPDGLTLILFLRCLILFIRSWLLYLSIFYHNWAKRIGITWMLNIFFLALFT